MVFSCEALVDVYQEILLVSSLVFVLYALSHNT